MSQIISTSSARERRCALAEQSLRVSLLLDGRRVHIAGVGRERALLRPLLNDFADSHNGYDYDYTEDLEVEWDTVEAVLNGSQVLEPQHIIRNPGPWELLQEEHAFGYAAEGRIWRFAVVVDNGMFCRLTHYHGLPPRWRSWHQGTTSNWQRALDKYPLLTRGDWARLSGQESKGDPAELQDPVPLLEQYASRQQAGKVLRVVPYTIRKANAFVKLHHRHNDPVESALFALCVIGSDGIVRGVAIVGRPVARMFDSGNAGEMEFRIAEVRRVATDGTYNASSMLYGAARRMAKDAGFEKIITYTLVTEPGTSLKASGWKQVALVKGRQWEREGREQKENPIQCLDKWRWEQDLTPARSVARIVFPAEGTEGDSR